ncbi:uncharacterized protein LOC129769419 [Toxorhynchites rutilus septentrionalis]|uniref:uncharacterized protein LOC129769419 n=1 Tax=Toxorhynchites rutilus septentrionalis TaxID=329112 RepID=UPI00247B1C39|nr:uncharacterized protein LOC129769419 [Toxorhynchites rutilus septentrionalis]
MAGHLPVSCCVSGCKTTVKCVKNIKSLVFPFVSEKPLRNRLKDECLYRKRYQLWLETLQLQPEYASSSWICHKHFVRGRPALTRQHEDIDWVPTLELSTDPVPPPSPAYKNMSAMLEDIGPQLDTTIEPKIERRLSIDEQTSRNEGRDLVNPFCRLCLGRAAELRPLFSRQNADNRLLELIDELVCIYIDHETDYNCFICDDCEKKLEEFQSIKLRWKANDFDLKSYRQNLSTLATIYASEYMPQEQNLPNASMSESTESIIQTKNEPYIQIEFQNELEEEASDPSNEQCFSSEDLTATVSVECLNECNEADQSGVNLGQITMLPELDMKIEVEEPQLQNVASSYGIQRNDPEAATSEIEEKERLIRKVMKMIRSRFRTREKKPKWKGKKQEKHARFRE